MGEFAEFLQKRSPDFRKSRLAALYSDFRAQRTLNPDGYQANIKAWWSALSLIASHGLLPRINTSSTNFVLDLDESLLRYLESRDFGQPLALGTAIREAVSHKDMIAYQDFIKAQTSIYHKTWSAVPWNVASWTLRTLGVISGDQARGGEDKLPKGRYVLMRNLEAAGAEVERQTISLTTRFDRVMTRQQFHEKFTRGLFPDQQRLPETDLSLLLQFLSRDKGMIVYQGQTLRIKGVGDNTDPTTADHITEEDRSMASLKDLMVNLQQQTEILNVRIDELSQNARTAVARKNRLAALAALKSKKIAESTLASRYATLNQIEEVAAKIEQAVDNVQLVKLMESSTGVLANLNKQLGGVEKVQGIMDALQEENSSADEIAAVLAEGNGVMLDEEELDDELEAMERQETRKIEEKTKAERKQREDKDAAAAREKLDTLPDVPHQEMDSEQTEKASTPTKETGIANLSIS